MKQSIKYLLFITLLFPCICACNQRKQNKLSGHIVFLHLGEENYTIWPLMILTGGDTSYLEYKKLDKKLSNENTVLTFVLPRKCVKINSDSILYKVIKNYLISNRYLKSINKNPDLVKEVTRKMEPGTFKVIIHDNRDSLGLVIPNGDSAKAIFSDLYEITRKFQIEDLSERFSYYKRMQ